MSRVDLKKLKPNEHWAMAIAEMVVERFPTLDVYTAAAGISPSGIVHFGNFRDVMTSLMVLQALQELGKKTRFIFSWDNYDRLRKVPAGVDLAFREHIGKPLSAIPDPLGQASSYARSFELPFEEAIKNIGIDLEYRNQTEMYTSGRYRDDVIHGLKARLQIADVLLRFMSDKGKAEKEIDEKEFREEFYPIAVYSRFSGKDTTKILNFDGQRKLAYRCLESGKEETIDLTTDFCVKFAWKVDWPMRWKYEGVVFEPGGKDHASPGGSYDVSSVVSEEIFKRPAPIFIGYEFVGIQDQGGKMSGSKGNAVSPAQLLEIYEPALLMWLYARRNPQQSFKLAFDTEVIRQYDEFDREVSQWLAGTLPHIQQRALLSSFHGSSERAFRKPIPFRQAVALGQIVQWNMEKVREIISALQLGYDWPSVEIRLGLARRWLEKYNPEEIIELRAAKNTEYAAQLSSAQREQIQTLRRELGGHDAKVQELETLVYAIPKDPTLSQKENAPRQRAFFKDVYNLLIGSDEGPRLSTFLWAADRSRVLELLDL